MEQRSFTFSQFAETPNYSAVSWGASCNYYICTVSLSGKFVTFLTDDIFSCGFVEIRRELFIMNFCYIMKYYINNGQIWNKYCFQLGNKCAN